MAELKKESNKQRLETAFDVAEAKLGIARLLDPEDVDVDKPDEKSIMTYVAQFLHKYPEPKKDRTASNGVSSVQQEYEELTQWLRKKTTIYDTMLATNSFPNTFDEYYLAKSELDSKIGLYNKLKAIVESQSSVITITKQSWDEIEKLWNKIHYQMLYWLWSLDSGLPGDFGVVGKWLSEGEKLINGDEIPSVMNEETASIISRKLEEHKKFFAAYPQIVEIYENAKRSPLAFKIPADHIRNLDKRIYEIESKAAQRRIRLKFLEHKCCLIAFLNLVENKLRGWTAKYGREDKVQQLLEQYKNFVSRNKIFQEFSKAYIDMQQVCEEYKRDGNITRRDVYEIDQFMTDIENRWKSVSMELRCAQSMLEEVVAYWKRWNSLSVEFEEWLNLAEQKVRSSEDDRLEFFQDISVWKDKHQMLGDTGNFLVATCEDNIAAELKDKYMNLTGRWESLFANTKQYMHAGDILRNRQDFKKGVEKLTTWLRNAESILHKQPLGTTDQIKAYGEELQRLQSEVEDVEELFKNVSKTFQTLIQDLSRDEVDKMMNTLKKEKEALVKVRAQIPLKLHLFHQLLLHHESIETGQKEIHQWLDEAENLLGTMTLAGGKENAIIQLNKHKSFFSRTLYYKSMLESKNNVFKNLLKSVDSDKSIDTSEAKIKMQQLNDRFNYVNQNAQQWEQRLQETMRCWNNFKECEHVISEWLNQAETLISEKHIDSKQSVETQKLFFENVNERWMNDLVQTAQELIKCLPKEEQQGVIDTVEKAQSKWREVLSFAPLHLMKLEFRLDENTFSHYIKEIEKELYSEEQALNRNEDVESILNRNRDFFKNKGVVQKLEKCLEDMQRISNVYSQHQPADPCLVDGYKNAEIQWETVAIRVEHIRKTLQQIPAQWDYYHEKFTEMVGWMNTVDESLKNIMNEVNTMEEFEKERIVFQVSKFYGLKKFYL